MRTTDRSAGVVGHRNCRGFTLLEMILVIATILFLLSVLVVMASSAHNDAKIRAAESLVAAIESAVMQYQASNGYYPQFTSGTANTENKLTGTGLYEALAGGGFLPQVPQAAVGYSDDATPKPMLVDPWSLAPTVGKSDQGNLYIMGQIFYVAFSRTALQPNSTVAGDAAQLEMWNLCGGVPLIWSMGPDREGYDARYVRSLDSASSLQDLLYTAKKADSPNRDNITNFRDIPLSMVK